MPDIIEDGIRKARKEHDCDLCGTKIKKGESYYYQKNKWDGRIYSFKEHERCREIASELWDFIDPDEGMDEDQFTDGCQEFCRSFVCPDCPDWNKEYQDCEKDESYCLDRIHEFLQTNELYYAGRKGYAQVWKCRPREGMT